MQRFFCIQALSLSGRTRRGDLWSPANERFRKSDGRPQVAPTGAFVYGGLWRFFRIGQSIDRHVAALLAMTVVFRTQPVSSVLHFGLSSDKMTKRRKLP